jgi:hypothetical protein
MHADVKHLQMFEILRITAVVPSETWQTMIGGTIVLALCVIAAWGGGTVFSEYILCAGLGGTVFDHCWWGIIIY